MIKNDIDILFKVESYKIIGAAISVHNELDPGFLEAVYQEAIEKEFIISKIPYKREVKLPVYYKGELLTKNYFADFLCFDQIILELKAVSSISSEHKAQILNYLKATKKELGIIINFGENKLKHERIIYKDRRVNE